ncbi:MAG: hypothetical protein VB857_18370, partial [Pirellulaceae bacterium]
MNQIPNHLIRYLAPTVAALLLLGSASRVQANPEVPGAAQKQPVALVGATIHPVSGPVLENGTLLFEKGRIVRIG